MLLLIYVLLLLFFFFFKQKTAYEMRISDWVQTCALPIYQTGSRWQVRTGEGSGRPSLGQMRQAKLADNDARIRELPVVKAALAAFPDARLVEDDDNRHRRSEESSVGKGGGRSCKFGW